MQTHFKIIFHSTVIQTYNNKKLTQPEAEAYCASHHKNGTLYSFTDETIDRNSDQIRYWTGIMFNQETNRHEFINGEKPTLSSEIKSDKQKRMLCVVANIQNKSVKYETSLCCGKTLRNFVCTGLPSGNKTKGNCFLIANFKLLVVDMYRIDKKRTMGSHVLNRYPHHLAN